jgi:ribosomal protein L19E
LADGAYYDFVQGAKLTVAKLRNLKKDEEVRSLIKQGMIDLYNHKQVSRKALTVIVCLRRRFAGSLLR